MLLFLVSDVAREVVVRVRSAENADAEGEVEGPHAVAGQADHQQARLFQPVRRLQASGIQGALFADCSAPGLSR
jgi:hypothetical protein